jgi:hypothetical protein
MLSLALKNERMPNGMVSPTDSLVAEHWLALPKRDRLHAV